MKEKLDFSEKEEQMLREIIPNMMELNDRGLMSSLSEIGLYALAAKEAFMKNLQTPAAESLRRCCKALDDCTYYRKTPMFEALIQL